MMKNSKNSIRTLAAAAALLAAPLLSAGAQTLYPAYQPPNIVDREYNFAVAGADVGTVLLFQWREGWSPISQLSFEGGLLDPKGDEDVRLLAGGNYGRQLLRATDDMPLDLLLTAGGNLIVGEGFGLEIPVGVSLGHRFPLEQGLAITPYIHPRVAFQYANPKGGDSDTDVGVAFDLGVNFEVSPRLSLRGTFMFGSDDNDAIGFSLAWRPVGMRR